MQWLRKAMVQFFGRKCFMVHSLSHAAEFFLIVTSITLRIGGLTISNNCICFVTDNAAQVEPANVKT